VVQTPNRELGRLDWPRQMSDPRLAVRLCLVTSDPCGALAYCRGYCERLEHEVAPYRVGSEVAVSLSPK
jgi:hypothetical protein